MILSWSPLISRGARRSGVPLVVAIALGGLALWLPATVLAQASTAGDSTPLETGRHLYIDGRLPDGTPLRGTRQTDTPVSGAAAACLTCHRRSGLGQVEGNIQIPPIAGTYLYALPGDKRLVTMDPHVSKSFNQAHAPYTDATLAAALRDGVNNQGKEMSPAMPRYALDDSQLQALTTYLKQLSADWSPGVTATTIRFATVITPDVDPARRQIVIDMIRSIVRQKNGSTKLANQGRTRHHMTSAAELVLGTERTWDLDIWELQGPPDTWNEQLSARNRANPVFALLSGVAAGTWQPVHDFCDREHIPCWFPSVDVPGQHTSDYAFYFSAGVNLEAGVLARHLREQPTPPKRLVQIHRDDATGRAAAQALKEALAGTSITLVERIVTSELPAPDALRHAIADLKPADTVMFWLRPADIAALGQLKPPPAKRYFSGRLAGGEHAPLTPAWRVSTSLVYPYELPDQRPKNLEYFHIWLHMAKLPLVDEALQSEVFFAMNFMTDTLSEMLDNLYRDYLVDRAESMLGIREGIKAAQETRDRVALGRTGELMRKHGSMTIDEQARIPIASHGGGPVVSRGTTLYPNLSLGPAQRFAAKSASIVRFAKPTGEALVAESEAIVP